MEPIMWLVLILATAVCAYMAWNIGANDVANAMGTSVGSRALTLKQAVIIVNSWVHSLPEMLLLIR